MYDFLDYSIVKSTILIVNLCICLSYPLNFGIYCGMSRQFRETFKELFMQRVMTASKAGGNGDNGATHGGRTLGGGGDDGGGGRSVGNSSNAGGGRSVLQVNGKPTPKQKGREVSKWS